MGTPVYRQQGVMLLHSVAPHIPTCHARMFECAAAHASGGNRQLYALFIEEFVTEAESHPELFASSILHRALRPLQQSAPAHANSVVPAGGAKAQEVPGGGAKAQVVPGGEAKAQVVGAKAQVVGAKAQVAKAQVVVLSGAKASTADNALATSEHKLVCPMCRSADESVIPFEKQRRSADEPAHQYAQCLNDDCRHVWLVSS